MKQTIRTIVIVLLTSGLYSCTGPDNQELTSDNREVFVNITEKAGLANTRDSFSHCWGDINGDGLPDIFVINHFQRPLLFSNNGDGQFRDITSESGLNKGGDQHGCAISDFDNDGDKDIYVTLGAAQGRGVGSNRLYQNNGRGIFTDIAFVAGVDNPKGRGRTVSWVDYNNDGFLDLFIANAKREEVSSVLFRNNGDQSFTDVSVQTGLNFNDNSGRSVWIDYDNDGFMDLTILKARKHDKHLIEIYRNMKGEKFQKTKTFYGWSYAWGDYDNDGDLDIFISTAPRYNLFNINWESAFLARIFSGFNKLYENVGRDQFSDVSEKAGISRIAGGDKPVFFDYDNDGDLDIYLVISGTKKNNFNDVFLENNGDKTFSNITKEIELVQRFHGRGRGVAYCDYNDDGFLDLFLTNGLDRGKLVWGRDAGPYVLYQNNGNDNNWLKINLIGTISNRDGIGAQVSLYCGETLQYRQNTGGMEGYVQHCNALHFGLGNRNTIDKIEIIWPSGIVTTMSNITTNQTLVIKEK